MNKRRLVMMNSSWKKHKIEKILSQSSNLVDVKPNEEYDLIGLRLSGKGLFVRETKKGIEISASRQNKLIKGRFIYSRLFAWKGSFDYVRDSFEGCYASSEFPTFEIDKSKINIDFLFYYFNQSKIWSEVEQYCKGVTKASRNRFKEEYFLSLEISLPPIEEQKRIVAKLKKAEENIKKIKELIERQEREINQFLFSVFQDLKKEFGLSELTEVISLRKEFSIIDDLTDYKLCRVQTKSKGVVLRSIKNGFDIKTKKQQFCKTNDFIVAEMDARYGGYGIIPAELNGSIVSSHYFLFEIDYQKILLNFLESYIQTIHFFSQVKAQGSTNYAAIRPNQVLNYKIPLPPLEEQNRIVKTFENLNNVKTKHEATLKELEDLFSSLLDKAFKGEI